ncbi:MAG: asparagine synthase (glutamine-hydrolyzing) [Chitinophagales bacterium]|nr:asparagine synthase (glutamine-hydrolyzing) [Chitinophagales bacterium]
MCGIAGLIVNHLSTDAKLELTHKMLRTITHRGPEASNAVSEGYYALGHNRLKIIDLSDEANQPFKYKDVTIVFNGEVYNYIELRAELEKKGYIFRTQSDTEVVCAAYKHWGDDCVKRFVGMWAFALWDNYKRRLFCSRDRFGIKPFYYIRKGWDIYFASEYKALKETPLYNAQLNKEQVNRGLQMVWAVHHEETFFKNIKSLPPAHNLVWENSRISINNYWDVNFDAKPEKLTWNEKKEKFYSLFEESIKLHSRSDVQNGTCLSGGLDSSSIASVYSKLLNGTPIKSFTVYYEDDVDERPFVEAVVEKYGNIQPHYFTPSNEQLAESFHRMAYHADVPVLGSSFISQYFLMQLAKSQGVTVVIDGQGSDEYLGGYLHSFYRVIGQLFSRGRFMAGLQMLNALSQRENFSSQKRNDFLLKSMVSMFTNEASIYHLELSRFDQFRKYEREDLQFATKTYDKFNNFLYHILMTSTLPTLLHFEDRNSMAFSLESRVPFLDHRLVEFAFTLTREDRISNKAETKYILRESLKNVLPEKVYARQDKKGFVTPGEVKWLNGPLKFLLDIDYERFNWLKQDKLRATVDAYKAGDVSKAAFVWRIACTHYWMKHFV